MFLRKGVLKICSKFTREHPCQSLISIKLQSNFIEIKLWYRCSPVNLLHVFRTSFLKDTSGRLLLVIHQKLCRNFAFPQNLYKIFTRFPQNLRKNHREKVRCNYCILCSVFLQMGFKRWRIFWIKNILKCCFWKKRSIRGFLIQSF